MGNEKARVELIRLK